MDAPRKAVVVGAGPVGCLTAISLAKMGWSVEIYEYRPDMRLPSYKAAAQQRSINLAISSRGIAALQAIEPGAGERFLQAAIPMHARMVHDTKGKLSSLPYDRNGQCINSIDRALLNEDLLLEALAVPNVRIFFGHKVISANFDARRLYVQDSESQKEITVPFDFCVGADGSYSIIRRQLMRIVRMDYQQAYLEHEYIELKVPAGPPKVPGGETTFLLDPNHLHIWPRHSFMLIALPNKDKTFTCTLFAPASIFDQLDSAEKTLQWFRTHFPDAVLHIGEDALLHDFQLNPRCSLVSVKAKPYHYMDRVIILGDAAHSMVPFFGQGLNCGLEDVRVLDRLLLNENVDPKFHPEYGTVDTRLAHALQTYSDTRHEDLITISDLATANYLEMRHTVTTPTYIARKALDTFLYSWSSQQVTPPSFMIAEKHDPFPTHWPSGWLPLYTMVTFRPDVSYSTVKRKSERQTEILKNIGLASLGLTVLTMGITSIALLRRFRD